jgi:hypothetical protein
MQIWLEHALRLAARRIVRDDHGQTEILIIVLLLFLVWLVSTGRRVVVQ